jgi:hypothetical protein
MKFPPIRSVKDFMVFAWISIKWLCVVEAIIAISYGTIHPLLLTMQTQNGTTRVNTIMAIIGVVIILLKETQNEYNDIQKERNKRFPNQQSKS